MTNDTKGKRKAAAEELCTDVLTMRRAPRMTLSHRFRFSCTPWHEVLSQPAGESYPECRGNRCESVPGMGYETLHDFFPVAPRKNVSNSRSASGSTNPNGFKQLKDVQHCFRQALRSKDSAEEPTLASKRFHVISGEIVDNRYPMQARTRQLIDYAQVGAIFSRHCNQDMIGNLTEASEQHDGHFECLESREGVGAAEQKIAHWQWDCGMLELFMMPREQHVRLDVGASPEPTETINLGIQRAL